MHRVSELERERKKMKTEWLEYKWINDYKSQPHGKLPILCLVSIIFFSVHAFFLTVALCVCVYVRGDIHMCKLLHLNIIEKWSFPGVVRLIAFFFPSFFVVFRSLFHLMNLIIFTKTIFVYVFSVTELIVCKCGFQFNSPGFFAICVSVSLSRSSINNDKKHM